MRSYDHFLSYQKDRGYRIGIVRRPWWVGVLDSIAMFLCDITQGRFCHYIHDPLDKVLFKHEEEFEFPIAEDQATEFRAWRGWERS